MGILKKVISLRQESENSSIKQQLLNSAKLIEQSNQKKLMQAKSQIKILQIKPLRKSENLINYHKPFVMEPEPEKFGSMGTIVLEKEQTSTLPTIMKSKESENENQNVNKLGLQAIMKSKESKKPEVVKLTVSQIKGRTNPQHCLSSTL